MPSLSAPPRPTDSSPRPALSSPDRAEWRLAAVAVLIGLVIVGFSLARHDGDITGLIKFGAGDDAVHITEHAEAELGREVATVPTLGHDGKFFFLQALDPLYLEPDEHAVHLDRPVYRGQRMLFPLLAGGGGLFPPALIPWTMALVNLVAITLGTVAAGRLARRAGATEWVGLAFALNPGILFEFDISGAGILAFAAALWGTLALEDERTRPAIAWFTVAVLAREVYFLYLGGVILLRWWRTRRLPFLLGAVPAAAAASWAIWLRLRLDAGSGVDEVQEFGVPFNGIVRSIPNWLDQPIDLAVMAGLLFIIPVFVVRAIRQPTAVAWGSLGFVLLAVVLSRQVWWRFFDITRAIAPVITAYVLTAFSAPRSTRDDAVSPS